MIEIEIAALIYVWSIAFTIDYLIEDWLGLEDMVFRILMSPFAILYFIVELHRGRYE